MARVRLGVALLVPPPLDREIDTLRRAVGDGSLERIPPHLTLVPPVNVHERDIDAAVAVLRSAAARTSPITVELGPPATFLPENPVAYLAVTGDVAAVHALRDAVFSPPLERPLSWPFVPHVTLADDAPPDRIHAALAALADYRVTVTFERVHILREEERTWRPFADATFRTPAVIGRGGLEVEITESLEHDPEATAFEIDQWNTQNRQDFGEMTGRHPYALVARVGGDIAGVARGWTSGGIGYLSSLIVDPAHRGIGVGSHLLAAFEDLAVRRECRRLALRTFEHLASYDFYLARGWRLEARFTDWIEGHTFVQLRRDL